MAESGIKSGRIGCKSCGAAIVQDNMKCVRVFSADNADDMGFLLEVAVDVIRCSICNAPTPWTYTIAVLWPEPEEVLIALGTAHAGCESDFADRLVILGAAEQSKPVFFQGISALRAELNKRASRFSPRMNELLQAFLQEGRHGDFYHYIQQSWRDFDRFVFAWVQVALSIKLDGLRVLVGFPDKLDSGQAHARTMEALANVQACVWVGMVEAWQHGAQETCTYEADLRRYIAKGASFPGVAEAFLRMMEVMDFAQADELTHYCVQASKSHVCEEFGIENGDAAEWAYRYIRFELAVLEGSAESSSQLLPYRMSTAFAGRTIKYEAAWRAVAGLFEAKQFDMIRKVSTILSRFGLDGLIDDIYKLGIQLIPKGSAAGRAPVSLIAAYIDNKPDSSIKEILAVSSLISGRPTEHGMVSEIERLADHLLTRFAGDIEARARIETWICAQLKELRRADLMLARLGPDAEEWESALSADAKLGLWVERSNALRLAGRHRESLAVLRLAIEVAGEAGMSEHGLLLERNLAILLRENGFLDEAIEVLEALARRVTHADRIGTLESLAASLSSVGRRKDAISHLQEALSLAVGPAAHLRRQILCSLANLSAIEDEFAAAVEYLGLIKSATLPPGLGERVLIANTWLNLLCSDTVLDEAAEKDASTAYNALLDEVKSAAAHQDSNLLLNGLMILAQFEEYFESPRVAEAWRLVEVAANGLGTSVPSQALAAIALDEVNRADFAAATEALVRCRESLSHDIGGIADPMSGVSRAGQLGPCLQLLANTAREKGAPWYFLRFVSELKRDLTWKSRVGLDGDLKKIRNEIPADAQIASLASRADVLAVLEWFDAQTPMLTVVKEQATSSRWLIGPELNVASVGEIVRTKLSNWTKHREGDPFDAPEWISLQRWLNDILENVADGGHLIVFEAPDHGDVPWHVAADDRWSCSYASGWSHLFEMGETEGVSSKNVAQILVPRHNESAINREAMFKSASRMRDLSFQRNLTLLESTDVDCDIATALHLLGRCDLAKFLCHGVVVDGEPAILLAQNGNLPPANVVALYKDKVRGHRLEWRDVLSMQKAAPVVFSAACSTGRGRFVGLGDRVSLFRALMERGTRSYISPKWDILTDEVLPLLDLVITRYLDGVPIGRALHTVCNEALSHHPRWIAKALALEGNWR